MSSTQVRAWVNGSRVDDAAAISALDHGLTVGDGVFETAKIVNGQPFALARHHARLDRSLAGLGLPSADRDLIGAGIDAVLEGEPIAFGRLRYSVTAGSGPLGSDRTDGAATHIVLAAPVPTAAPVTTVTVVPWTRNERAATVGLKTTSYAENVIALAAAKARGGSEAILTNTAGLLCEGTGSNIFVVHGGVVLTPALGSGPLAGITRELVIEWSGEAGFEVVESELPLSILTDADEAFLTSSTRDVQAIGRIEVATDVQSLVGPVPDPELTPRDFDPAPGPVTTALQEIFARRSTENPNP